MIEHPFRRLRAALEAAAGTAAQTAVIDFKAGPGSGVYSFAGWTPTTLPELMRGQGSGEAQSVTGHLFLPPGDASKARERAAQATLSFLAKVFAR